LIYFQLINNIEPTSTSIEPNYQALPFHGKPDEMNVGQIRGTATLQSDRSPL